MALSINAISNKVDSSSRRINTYKFFSETIFSMLQNLNIHSVIKPKIESNFFRYLAEIFFSKYFCLINL